MINRSCITLLVLLAGCATGEQASTDDAARSARTPYTADQIRESNPVGTRLVFRMERVGEPTVLNVMTFVEADAERAVTESQVTSLSGEPLGDTRRSEATWTELRDHAVFPASRTHRRRTSATVPAGTFTVWLYTVGDDDGTGESRFSFAVDRAGPPVLLETRVDGEITLRMVLIEDSRGD